MSEIAVWVGRFGHIPTRWIDDEAFPAGTITLPQLHKLAGEVDAAVFVFSDEDRTWYRGHEISSPRDNVLFEYGLFSGKLGLGRVVIVQNSPTIGLIDLEGLTVIRYSKDQKIVAEAKFRQWIDALSTGRLAAPALPVDAPLYRMLQVISDLDLRGITPTAGHIFHLQSGEDRVLEAMLVNAIERNWVRASPDPSGLMVYHVTSGGEAELATHL